MMKKRTEKKQRIHWILSSICLAAFLAAGGYFAMCRYYEDADFICGTWINGIYCAGKTIEEVEDELIEQYGLTTIHITDQEGRLESIAFAELAPLISCQFKTNLKLLSGQPEQIATNWIFDTFHPKAYTLQPELIVTGQEAEQLAYLSKYLTCLREGQSRPEPAVRMQKGENGYELIDEKQHYFLPQEAACAIMASVATGRHEIFLAQEDCYTDLAYTTQERRIKMLFQKVEAFQDCQITYLFGEDQEVVDASVVCDWIATQEDGSFVLDEAGNLVADEEKILAYIDDLAAEYDTYGTTREFEATRGEKVTIEGGTYGNQLNKKAEATYLKDAFARKAKETHEPIYLQKAWVQGKNDIGDTYIEIDMTQQTMYYYKDGECVISTPIVTGNMMRRRDTPEAVCYVYAKQKNRVLRGPGYASPVKFWMPVKGGIGIHDASWRKEFGGEIYKTDGSHGCINTPYEAVEQLFQAVEIGMPVVMFY